MLFKPVIGGLARFNTQSSCLRLTYQRSLSVWRDGRFILCALIAQCTTGVQPHPAPESNQSDSGKVRLLKPDTNMNTKWAHFETHFCNWNDNARCKNGIDRNDLFPEPIREEMSWMVRILPGMVWNLNWQPKQIILQGISPTYSWEMVFLKNSTT